jgi:murein DD-endopeptidase MepM/ murein hydrolase activator NlpD
MRDQPDHRSREATSDTAVDAAASPTTSRDTDLDISAAVSLIAATTPPTLVGVPLTDDAGLAWLKRGAGLAGIALLAAIGWFALDLGAPRTASVADRPPPTDPTVSMPAPDPMPAERPVPTTLSPAPANAPPARAAETPPAATDTTPPQPIATSRDDDGEVDKPEPMDRYEATVRIEKGDTLESLLRDMDFAPDEVSNALRALKPLLKGARLPVGETIVLRVQTPATADAKPVLQALIIRPEVRREITVERGGDGGYSAKQRSFDVVLKLTRGGGVVKGSLRASADAAGLPAPVLAELIRAYSWDVNFQYDVKAGDRFSVLLEQPYTTDGRLAGAGRVLWAQLTTGAGRNVYSVYRFKPEQGAEFFYYGNGQSVVKSFLRTPMDLSRVSSRFGLRNHPILGFTAMHAGVDFAAPYGTPILAAGAGSIAQAGPNGGYGNWVKIDHGAGVSTGYAHMARFAPGIRPGARVRQGQVVGFVGSTGLSTGPHLHYELHQKGKPVNPLNARATQRASLAGKDLERFKAVVARTDRARDTAELLVKPISDVRGGE